MDENFQENLKEFFKRCYVRLENGEKETKNERYKNLDLFEEICDELADVSNYAFLQYLKIMELKEKTTSIS